MEGNIDFFNTLVVPLRKIASAKYENNFVLVILHDKLFNILQVLKKYSITKEKSRGILLHPF